MQNFEKLPIYQEAIDLVGKIYKITKEFPKREDFVISAQLRRAVISVPLNIAEGQGRSTFKDNRQFAMIARGSLYEVLAILEICLREKYVDEKVYNDLRIKIEGLLKQFSGYIRYLNKK